MGRVVDLSFKSSSLFSFQRASWKRSSRTAAFLALEGILNSTRPKREICGARVFNCSQIQDKSRASWNFCSVVSSSVALFAAHVDHGPGGSEGYRYGGSDTAGINSYQKQPFDWVLRVLDGASESMLNLSPSFYGRRAPIRLAVFFFHSLHP